MSDEKKFDPERTMTDIKPPGSSSAPESGGSPPAEERTMVMSRDSLPAADLDRTMVSAPRRSAEAMPIPDAGPPSGFEVVALSGPARGRRFDVPEGGALIGSNPTCHVVVPDIEGAHAKISKRGEQFEIQNLGTSGSVMLSGGRTVTTTRLNAGDLIKLGDTVVRFVRSGEVFSAEYEDKEFNPSLLTNLLAPERRVYLYLAAAVGLILLLLLSPARGPQQVVVQKNTDQSDAELQKKKQVDALLAAGETLMKEGRLFAPTDRPDAESAFAKFNEALALDPGNDRALAAMKQIDTERDRQRRAKEEEQKRQEDARRKALETKVAAAIAKGDELFQKGQVTEPAGNNALIHYREALKIDPMSDVAQERMNKALSHYVEKGDDARDKGDLWVALENYRKASRAAEGRNPDIEARLNETETHLKAGMAGTDSQLIIYKDDSGRTVVLDDMDKVPARYRDRALTVQPQPRRPQ